MADVKLSGPLFDGRAGAALRDGITAVRRKVAAEGEKLTVAAFSASIRRESTGRMLRSVTTTDRTHDYQTGKYSLPVVVTDLAETIVTTDLATYGPWLEGTGSRNETTRFKGYHGFRQAAQELNSRAGSIASEAFRPYTEAMNG